MISKNRWPAAALVLAIAPQAWGENREGSIGAGALYAPDYLGSDDYDTQLWPSIKLNYGDEEWTESMFGVSAREGCSGVSPYNPDGGYWRLGLSSSLTNALTPEWSATGFVGTRYLTGNASDSPIVDDLGSEWQTITGVSLNYNF